MCAARCLTHELFFPILSCFQSLASRIVQYCGAVTCAGCNFGNPANVGAFVGKFHKLLIDVHHLVHKSSSSSSSSLVPLAPAPITMKWVDGGEAAAAHSITKEAGAADVDDKALAMGELAPSMQPSRLDFESFRIARVKSLNK